MKKYLFALIVLVFSCKMKTVVPTTSDDFADAQDLGIVENREIDEASGMVSSYRNKGLLWTHNDSGDKNRIFSMDAGGKGTREFYIEGAINRDWEAVSVANFTEGSFVYVGDIGDNNTQYGEHIIYRAPEPEITGNTPQINTISNVQKIIYKYPDGLRDAECLLIDQVSKDIYIITKRENAKRLYRLPYPQAYNQVITAEFVQELDFSVGTVSPLYITDGNVSMDNQEIIVRNYLQIFHWRRGTNETIPEALKRTPIILPYTPEPQGEGLCFAQDGSGYYTISEENDKKILAHLYYYKRK
jgi:hypothetical protein